MKTIYSILLLVLSLAAFKAEASDTLRVLFIGNSYTYVNDLPGLTRDLSLSKGKTLLIDSYTPGGYSWSQHATDGACLTKIRQGNWNAVILQEQSQMPSIDYYRYNYSLPGISALADSISLHNPCARLILYMTWGRRFGGQQCISGNCSVPFVDFNHMQDTLRSAYESFADGIGGTCAPVGMAWKKALEDSTMVLHSSDNSHPALTGSYLAACVFYATLWRENSNGAAFTGGLSSTDAARFQTIADSTVFFGVSDWNLQVDIPVASFSFAINGLDVSFDNSSVSRSGAACHWDFGDGTTSQDCNPTHSYSVPGVYDVLLVMNDCGQTDSVWNRVTVSLTGFDEHANPESKFRISPNPSNGSCLITLNESGIHHLQLVGIDGKTYIETDWFGNEVRISLDEVSHGIYQLIVDGNSKKLVVAD